MKKLVKAFALFQWTVEKFSNFLLVFMTIIVFLQVILRYFFDSGIPWVEEIALLCVVWYGFISMAFGLLCKEHIYIEAFTHWLPQPVRRWIDRINYLLIAGFGLFLAYYGLELCRYATRQTLPATKWPYTIVYASLPFAGILFAVYCILVATGAVEKYPQFKCREDSGNTSADSADGEGGTT